VAVPGIEAPSLLGSSEDASELLLLDASSSLSPSNFGLPLYPMARTKRLRRSPPLCRPDWPAVMSKGILDIHKVANALPLLQIYREYTVPPASAGVSDFTQVIIFAAFRSWSPGVD
jgi:hypothetical protein